MKKKTEAIVYILIIFIIALIISGIIVFAKRNEPKKENIALEAYEIANVEEVSKDIPEFKVEIIGDYEGLLDNNIYSPAGSYLKKLINERKKYKDVSI